MNSKLFRGSLDTIILKLLSEHSKMYGYEITQKVKEQSNETFKITEGALYPALHKLEAKGWLESETISIGNRNRKYYSLTESGRGALVSSVKEMQDFIAGLQLFIEPKLA